MPLHPYIPLDAKMPSDQIFTENPFNNVPALTDTNTELNLKKKLNYLF